jgi:hypothetical protein
VFGVSFLDELGAIEYFKHFWASIIEIYKDIFSFLKDIYYKYLDLIWGKDEDKDTPEPKEEFFRENTPLEIKSEEKENWNWINIAVFSSIIIAGCFIYVYFDDIKEWWGKGDGGDSGTVTPDEIIINNETSPDKRYFKNPLPSSSSLTLEKLIEDPLRTISEANQNKDNVKTDLTKSVHFTKVEDNSSSEYYKLNSPTSSTSSIETITQDIIFSRTSFENKHFHEQVEMLTKNGIVLKEMIVTNWKCLVDKDIYEGMIYIEKNFPKSFLDETEYIKTLLNDIKILNKNFAKGASLIRDSLSENELLVKLTVAQETEKWILEVSQKLELLQ